MFMSEPGVSSYCQGLYPAHFQNVYIPTQSIQMADLAPQWTLHGTAHEFFVFF